MINSDNLELYKTAEEAGDIIYRDIECLLLSPCSTCNNKIVKDLGNMKFQRLCKKGHKLITIANGTIFYETMSESYYNSDRNKNEKHFEHEKKCKDYDYFLNLR